MVDLIPEKLWYLTWVPAGDLDVSLYPENFRSGSAPIEYDGVVVCHEDSIYRVSRECVRKCVDHAREWESSEAILVGLVPEILKSVSRNFIRRCDAWRRRDSDGEVLSIASERCSITECRVLKDREDGRFLIDSIFGLRTVEEGSLFTSEASAKESVIGLCPECAEKNKSKSRILGAWAGLKPGLLSTGTICIPQCVDHVDGLGQKCGEKNSESKSNRSELCEVVEAAVVGSPMRLEIVNLEPLLKIRDVESGEVHNFDRLGEFYTWLGGIKLGYARGASDHGGVQL